METEGAEADAKAEKRNLSEIMMLLLHQYQNFVAVKEKLENKANRCLTPLSILLIVSVAAIIAIMRENRGMVEIFFLLAFTFSGQVYFAVWTFIFALRVCSSGKDDYPDIKEYLAGGKEDADFFGGINRSFEEVTERLNVSLKKLFADVKFCKIFFVFSIVFGALTVSTFIAYMLYFHIYMKI